MSASVGMARNHIRRQVGALPFRRTAAGALEVALITSRDTARLIIPKGWPSKRLRNAKAAAREAFEEAGLIGKIDRQPVGTYRYQKQLAAGSVLVDVEVFALAVRHQSHDWPERSSRQMAWLSPEAAARAVDDPELGALIRQFVRSSRFLRIGTRQDRNSRIPNVKRRSRAPTRMPASP